MTREITYSTKNPEPGVTTRLGQPQSYFQLDPRRHITSHQQTSSTERPLLSYGPKLNINGIYLGAPEV